MSSTSHHTHLIESPHIRILYGSETGNAQDVAERIAREVHQRQFKPQISAMDEYPLANLVEETLVIFVCSTTGNGVEPRNMNSLWQSLLRSDLPEDLFDEMNFTVFGLGDSSYERFNWAAKKLHRRLQSLGARELLPRGDADDQHFLGIEGALNPWIDQLLEMLSLHHPLPDGLQPAVALTVPPPPRAKFISISNSSDTPNPPQSQSPLPLNGVDVTLRSVERITDPGWFQDVRHVAFSCENEIRHEPGDVAVLWPENSVEDTEALLSRLGWPQNPDDLFRVEPTDLDWPLPKHLPTTSTIRELLTRYLDITAVPRRSFFDLVRHFAQDEREKEKLDEFCSPEGQDELFSYCNKPRRTLSEVLAEFKSINIPFEYLLDVFPLIRPRQFSIASSDRAFPREVHLCVAIVKYKTLLKAPRKGLCTTWLTHLSPGTKLRIEVRSGTMVLPEDTSVPVILIGPGTGVAPMRAFIQQRIANEARDNILYFGCRSNSADCHYKDEWQEYAGQGSLVYRVACSRDQENKVYVQHLISEDSRIIWEWVVNRGAHVYISGSSNQMPKGVRNAFARALCEQGGWDEARAIEYVQEMERSGRWGEECWS